MLVFQYDKTFEGLLCAVFDAYSEKTFPERLIAPGEPAPLFSTHIHPVTTTPDKSNRVWKGLQKKLPAKACNMLFHVWLSELPASDELLFRYIRKIFDSNGSAKTDFNDPDMLEVHKIALQVSREAEHIRQFVRFQKAGDNTYFAPITPKYNCLPLSLSYFRDRFADQRWMIYDTRRGYGFYCDLQRITEIQLPEDPMTGGQLNQEMMAEDEQLFQRLWRGYHKALTIKERINPKAQRQHMPQRFWKYLIEMQ